MIDKLKSILTRYEELEKLMIELALKSREIRELEAVSGNPTDR